jgi:hypothetical protein
MKSKRPPTETAIKILDKLSKHTGQVRTKKSETIHDSIKRVLSAAYQTMPMLEIADICKVSCSTVWRHFKKCDIPSVTKAEAYKRFQAGKAHTRDMIEKSPRYQKPLDAISLRRLIYAHRNVAAIAAELDTSYSRVTYRITAIRKQTPGWVLFLCKNCEKKFIPGQINQRYCTPQCGNSYRRKFARFQKEGWDVTYMGDAIICTECGANFTMKTSNVKVCSPGCSRERENRLRREKRAAKRKVRGEPAN